jgi:hypothetical protein
MAAIHEGDNAAGLHIPTPGVVFQPHAAQFRATVGQDRVENQDSSWSVISGTNTCDELMNYEMALLPLIVQQQRLFQSVLAVIFMLK